MHNNKNASNEWEGLLLKRLVTGMLLGGALKTPNYTEKILATL